MVKGVLILKTVIKYTKHYPLNFVLPFELALLTDSYQVESEPFSCSPEPLSMTRLAIQQKTEFPTSGRSEQKVSILEPDLFPPLEFQTSLVFRFPTVLRRQKEDVFLHSLPKKDELYLIQDSLRSSSKIEDGKHPSFYLEKSL